MNQRFTLDRRSFEQFLAALSLVQQLKRQAAYQRAASEQSQPFFSLLQLQRAINSGTVDLPFVMANIVKLTQSVVGANAAGVWLFRDGEEFSCCAQIGAIHDPERLGVDILAQLASSTDTDSSSCAFSPTLRRASHYPGLPHSAATVPLRVNSKLVGALAAFSSDFDAFASRDLDNLRFLAGLLEQALARALQSGCREAVAVDHAALLQLLERISPQGSDFEPRAMDPEQARFSKVEDPLSEGRRGVYSRLQEAASAPASSSAPAQASADVVRERSESDIYVPGIGVRAALGDVREFTGEEKPFSLWQAARTGSERLRGFGTRCWSGALSAATATTSRIRQGAMTIAGTPRNLLQAHQPLSFARFLPVRGVKDRRFARIKNLQVKVRFAGLGRLRPSTLRYLQAQWFNSARSRLQLSFRPLASKSDTWLSEGQDRITLLLRLAKIQGRSMRSNLRQLRANLGEAFAHERIRLRIAQRRQKRILTNSAEVTGDALQHAGGALAHAASSAGTSTVTVVFALRTRLANLRGIGLNRRALGRSAGAMIVLAIMAVFLALQAGVRHSLEHVDTATASAPAAAVLPNVSATVANAAIPAKTGPTTHLEITDPAVADTLHDLTRYEIATLQRAAEYGDDDAAFQLAMAYETGYYLRQNCSKAAHWVKMAAESGNSAAAYNLGLRYRVGDGLEADQSAAEHWLRMASLHDYSPAKLALAAVR